MKTVTAMITSAMAVWLTPYCAATEIVRGVSDKSVNAVNDGIQHEYTGQLANVTATITATVTTCSIPLTGTMKAAPATPQMMPAETA